MGELSVSEFLTNNLGPEGPVLMQTYFYCLHIYFISPPKRMLCVIIVCNAFWMKCHICQTVFGKSPRSFSLYLVVLVPVCYHSQCKRRQGKTPGWVFSRQGNSPVLVTVLRGSKGNIGQHIPLFNQELKALCKTYLRKSQVKPMVRILRIVF